MLLIFLFDLLLHFDQDHMHQTLFINIFQSIICLITYNQALTFHYLLLYFELVYPKKKEKQNRSIRSFLTHAVGKMNLTCRAFFGILYIRNTSIQLSLEK
jgi:hypothetical protein